MTAPVPCPLGCCSAGQLSVLQGQGFLSSSHSAAHSQAGKKRTQVITRLQKAATELRARVLSWAAATGVPQTPALILHAGKLLSSMAPSRLLPQGSPVSHSRSQAYGGAPSAP